MAKPVIMRKITALSWWHHLFWWHLLSLCEGLWPCAGGRPFVSSWSGLKADKTTCMPFAQMILLSNWIYCIKYNFDVVSMYLSSWINESSFSVHLIFACLHWEFGHSGAKLCAELRTGSFFEWVSRETGMSANCAFSGLRQSFWRNSGWTCAKSDLRLIGEVKP